MRAVRPQFRGAPLQEELTPLIPFWNWGQSSHAADASNGASSSCWRLETMLCVPHCQFHNTWWQHHLQPFLVQIASQLQLQLQAHAWCNTRPPQTSHTMTWSQNFTLQQLCWSGNIISNSNGAEAVLDHQMERWLWSTEGVHHTLFLSSAVTVAQLQEFLHSQHQLQFVLTCWWVSCCLWDICFAWTTISLALHLHFSLIFSKAVWFELSQSMSHVNIDIWSTWGSKHKIEFQMTAHD